MIKLVEYAGSTQRLPEGSERGALFKGMTYVFPETRIQGCLWLFFYIVD